MSVISMEEIADKRWRNMLIMCDYTAFGTLWCVSENVWKTTLPDRKYDKENNRKIRPAESKKISTL